MKWLLLMLVLLICDLHLGTCASNHLKSRVSILREWDGACEELGVFVEIISGFPDAITGLDGQDMEFLKMYIKRTRGVWEILSRAKPDAITENPNKFFQMIALVKKWARFFMFIQDNSDQPGINTYIHMMKIAEEIKDKMKRLREMTKDADTSAIVDIRMRLEELTASLAVLNSNMVDFRLPIQEGEGSSQVKAMEALVLEHEAVLSRDV